MDIRIVPRVLRGCVMAPPSKSQAVRLIICAALADLPTKINIVGVLPDDIRAALDAAAALGCGIIEDNGYLLISPPVEYPKKADIFCRESGAVARFTLPVAAALCDEVFIDGDAGLRARPMDELISETERHGCFADGDSLPLKLTGRLRPGEYVSGGKTSSQYASGLLLALSVLPGESVLTVGDGLENSGYIAMTVEALRLFGADIEIRGQRFYIKGGRLKSPGSIDVEGDWSGAAYLLSCGRGVELKGLNPESCQRDKEIVPLLSEIRTLQGGEIDIDCGNIPDLAPVLAAAAASCRGVVRLYKIERLRFKESDRIKAICETMSALGADISLSEEGLVICGADKLHGAVVSSFGDHRIDMAAAAAAAAAAETGKFDGELIIRGAEAVNKSYPGFFTDYVSLGGEIYGL
jgi:3-phosphoshikimate 1-carboxyvinyltransferase